MNYKKRLEQHDQTIESLANSIEELKKLNLLLLEQNKIEKTKVDFLLLPWYKRIFNK